MYRIAHNIARKRCVGMVEVPDKVIKGKEEKNANTNWEKDEMRPHLDYSKGDQVRGLRGKEKTKRR